MVLIASFSYAQSLALSWKDGDLQNGDEVVFLEEPEVVLITAHVFVKNISDAPKSVKVKMHEVSVIPSTIHYFCWAGSCFPPGTLVSLSADTLEPGELNESGFYGDYVPSGIQGTSRVKYTFFDENNPNDSACVVVSYISGFAGLDETIVGDIQWSKPYPNPADQFAYFDYNLPDGHLSARLDVYDLLGSVVRTISLTEQLGQLRIPTGDLREGMYFYTLNVGNTPVTTGKLVVSR